MQPTLHAASRASQAETARHETGDRARPRCMMRGFPGRPRSLGLSGSLASRLALGRPAPRARTRDRFRARGWAGWRAGAGGPASVTPLRLDQSVSCGLGWVRGATALGPCREESSLRQAYSKRKNAASCAVRTPCAMCEPLCDPVGATACDCDSGRASERPGE